MQSRIAIGLVVVACMAAGCSGNGTTGFFNQPAPRIRAINGLDGVTTANWSVTNQNSLSFPAIPYGGISNSLANPYVILNERGDQMVNFYNANNPTVSIASARHNFTYGDKLTVIAWGSTKGNTIQLYDQTTNSTNGPNVRVVNTAQQLGNVDVFIFPSGQGQPGTPSATLVPGGVFPGQPTPTGYSYTALPLPGSYTVNFYHQGVDTGAPLLSYNLNVISSDVWTLVLFDPATVSGAATLMAIPDNNPNAG